MGYCHDLDDVQDEIGKWGDNTFPLSTPLSVLAHFAKEAIEWANSELDALRQLQKEDE